MVRARRKARSGKAIDSSSRSSQRSGSTRRRFVAWIAASGITATLVMAILAGATFSSGYFGLEWKSQDLRFQLPWLRDPVTVDPRIHFAQIDDASLHRYGPWPWPRWRQAQAIREIFRSGASVVALDLTYVREQEEQPLETPELDATGAGDEGIASDQSTEDQSTEDDQGRGPGPAVVAPHSDDQQLAQALASRRPDQGVVLAAQLGRFDDSTLGATAAQRDEFFQEFLKEERRKEELGKEEHGSRPESEGDDATGSVALIESTGLDLEKYAATHPLHDPGRFVALFRNQTYFSFELLMRDQRVRAADALDRLPPSWAAMQRRVERSYQAWKALGPSLRVHERPDGGGRIPIPAGTPILPLAEVPQVSVGMVDIDPEAAVRFVEVSRPGPNGSVPNLGLAAALEYQRLRGQDATWDVDHARDELILGAAASPWSTLPLQISADGGKERLWIHWPDDHPGGLARSHGSSFGMYVTLSQFRQDRETTFFKKLKLLWSRLGMAGPPPVDGHRARALLVEAGLEPEFLEQFGDDAGQDPWAGDPDPWPWLGEYAERSFADFARKWSRSGIQSPVPLDLSQLRRLFEERLQDRELSEDARAGYEDWLSQVKDLIPLEGKIVFVGFTAGGNFDVVHTPLDVRTPGVHVHGVVADMALPRPGAGSSAAGRGLKVPDHWIGTVLATLLLGGIVTALVCRLSLRMAAICACGIGVTYLVVFGLGWFAWYHTMLPLAAPLITGVLVLGVCLFVSHQLTERERAEVIRLFSSRVSEDVAQELMKQPEQMTHKGQRRICTVLFIDLRNFTTLSERLTRESGPERPVAVLNDCLREIAETVKEHKGTVNKFLGDGAMAFWSAFQPEPDQERLACEAALECMERIRALRKTPRFRGIGELSCRIGIATGPVIVGDVGSEASINDYTVIGNDVNLAARLESANKSFGTSILINGVTQRKIRGLTHLRTRPMGRIQVVGQKKDVSVHELLEPGYPENQAEVTRALVEAFAHGDWSECQAHLDHLERIERGQWQGAPEAFAPSGLIQIYRQELAAAEPEKGRVIVLQTK